MIVANRVTSRICEPFSAKEARPLNLRSKIVKSGTPMSRRIVTSPIWGKVRISWGVVPAISIPEISMAKGPIMLPRERTALSTGPGSEICAKNRKIPNTFARKNNVPIMDKPGEHLTVMFDSRGVSLTGYGLTYQGDFEGMLHRVTNGRLSHEMLVRAVKTEGEHLKAIDATAGMGEDGFLLAAYGYEVTLYEQNPVIAALLKDALRRARKHPVLKDIASRMKLVEGDSVSCMEKLMDPVDVIYLDPMFPKRQKSGLINKKLQLIQKLEPPCSEEKDLFDAAIKAGPSRIIVKRPLKSVCLDGREPSYILKGKAIRYDCYVM